jgi:hypothetical protein
MREIRHRNRDYTIQGVASSYEHGYEVSYKDKDDRSRSVQFRIFLNSAMKLVAVANAISPWVSVADIVAAREVADAELTSNPSPFHILTNAHYDMQRLRRAADQARNLGKLSANNPHLLAVESRIVDLGNIVRDAHEWASKPERPPLAQFLGGHEIEANKRDFEVVPKLEAGDEFRFHPAMGPLELYCGIRLMEQKPDAVVMIDDLEVITGVPSAISERSEFRGMNLGRKVEEDLNITSARMWELRPPIADHLLNKMSGDCVVVGWTRQTETAAFDSILDWFEKSGLDPKVVIGSPEGTFSGRASAIRLALGISPTLNQATSAPALR